MTDIAGISAFTQKRIAALAAQALRDADALDALPTPVEDVGRAAGVLEVVGIERLPDSALDGAPESLHKVLGAVIFAERVAFVDRTLDLPRQRFTELHEAAHLMLPWHEATVLLDDSHRLSSSTKEYLEMEANLGAAHLLFQNGRLHKLADQAGRGLQAALAVAPAFAASGHAALRYYAEHHPSAAVALIVAGRIPRMDGLPVWQAIDSPAFRERYLVSGHLGSSGCLALDGPTAIYGEVLAAIRKGAVHADQRVHLSDRSGTARPFTAEAWSNGRSTFVLVTEHDRVPSRYVPAIGPGKAEVP